MGFKQFDGGGGGGGGGGGTPALPFNSVQFNAAGAFGGDANLTWVPASGPVGHLRVGGASLDWYDGISPVNLGATSVAFTGTIVGTAATPPDVIGVLSNWTYDPPASGSIPSVQGVWTSIETPAANAVNMGSLYANLTVATHNGSGNMDALYAHYNDAENLGSGTIGNLYGVAVDALNLGAGLVDSAYGYKVLGIGGGSTTSAYSFYSNDIAGKATNPYYSWFDSRGVLRVKEDSAVDGGNAQAIQALYNPRFAKYTAGAANFERGVQQWNTNVLEYGAEAGGTGIQRNFRLLGAEINIPSLSASLPVFTDGSKNLISPTANDALNALLPSQTGNSGKFLTTDATNASWATISSTPAFSAITAGTNAAALVVGTGGSLGVSGSGTINATSLGGTAAASYALLAGPTFTTNVTTPKVTITQGTITADAPGINHTVTWNNAGIVGPAWKLNVTATSYDTSAAKLVQWQVGGVDRFFIYYTGSSYFGPISGNGNNGNIGLLIDPNTPSIAFRGGATIASQIVGSAAGNPLCVEAPLGVSLRNAINSSANAATLICDSNHILAQRSGTAAQAVRWENTYTGTTNREYATADWITTANLFRLMTVKGSGGGTARAMALGTDSVDRLTFGAAGNATFATPVVLSTAVPLSMSSGTDQRAGDTTLVGGTKTVNNTTVTANTRVFAQRKTAGGTIGMSLTYTVIAATSFTLTSDNILDTSVYSYWLLEIP